MSLLQLLCSRSFLILLNIEDSTYDLLEKIFLFCPIRCIASSFLSDNDQIIDSLDKVPSFENEAPDWILDEVWLHPRPSILVISARIELQTVNNLFVPQEASSYDILLQTILIEPHFPPRTA